MKKSEDHADIVARPPVIYLVPLIAGYFLNKWINLKILSDDFILNVIGWILIVSGVLIILWTIYFFTKEKEDVRLEKPTNKIIIKGPFRFSRNPIYLSFNLGYIGISFISNNLWLIIFLPIAFIVLYYWVVLREEEYLEKKFGKKYQLYKKKVRRWI